MKKTEEIKETTEKIKELREKLGKAKTNQVITESQRKQLVDKYEKEIDILQTKGANLAVEEISKTKSYKDGLPYYIEYLNKEKGFKKDEERFKSQEEAEVWGKKNIPNFHLDMVKIDIETGVKEFEKKVEKVHSKAKKEHKTYSPSKEDCEQIIKDEAEKAKKARVSAKKSAKKSPTTKSKEKIEKVEDSVIGRVKDGTATKAEIKALIKKTEELLSVLKKALEKL